jgi:hypothetical protein
MTKLEELKAARDKAQSDHDYWCAAYARGCGDPAYTWAKRWDAHERAVIASRAYKTEERKDG